MAKIRKLEIENFRCIQSLKWCPEPGINCLVGPGDSGKSTILEAIDLCLGARRNLALSDVDFHQLNVAAPISITLTLGALDESLMSVESYGLFLRSFDAETQEIDDEPERDGETVLTLNLKVEQDLEPVWSLVSQRADSRELVRNLAWKDRTKVAPTRLGTHPGFNLSWARGSILNRLGEEKADVALALMIAARDARNSFGDKADKQLKVTLDAIEKTAREMGVPIGKAVRALLDAHSVSFGDGAIALHDDGGVPLRSLGTGSSRLLMAGLQRKVASTASIVLADEIEFGLEPHRLTRLLGSLGAREDDSKLQVFMTTHSPVTLRELDASQLFVLRTLAAGHVALPVGVANQGLVRRAPGALLAATVLVCEGKTEMGFGRGMDDYRVAQGQESLHANGVEFFNAEGSHPDSIIAYATAFLKLGYRACAFLDNDTAPSPAVVKRFCDKGGYLAIWAKGRTLEDELFQNLPTASVAALIELAIAYTGGDTAAKNVESASSGIVRLPDIRAEIASGVLSEASRTLLAKASQTKNSPWFKDIPRMQRVARQVVGPVLVECSKEFQETVNGLFTWAQGA